MQHLQGGLLIIRRSTYEKLGGFSDAVPHNGTDIEYSYYLESSGAELLDIPNIYSISSKTWPGAGTLIDEETMAMHALTSAKGAAYTALNVEKRAHCNLCDWQGDSFEDGDLRCPACGSQPFHRSAMRHMSLSGMLQLRPRVVCLDAGEPLVKALRPVCKKAESVASREWISQDPGPVSSNEPTPMIVVDLEAVAKTDRPAALSRLAGFAARGGRIVFTGAVDECEALAEQITRRGASIAEIESASNVTRLASGRVCAVNFPPTREAAPLGAGGSLRADAQSVPTGNGVAEKV